MNIPCWMRPAVPVIQYKEQQMIGCRGSPGAKTVD